MVGRRGGFAMSDLTGKPAVPFRLRDSEGRIHRLEEYRGGWLLMVFHRHLG
jgi:peroxiredoxin